jgi:hypothetical protein
MPLFNPCLKAIGIYQYLAAYTPNTGRKAVGVLACAVEN